MLWKTLTIKSKACGFNCSQIQRAVATDAKLQGLSRVCRWWSPTQSDDLQLQLDQHQNSVDFEFSESITNGKLNELRNIHGLKPKVAAEFI